MKYNLYKFFVVPILLYGYDDRQNGKEDPGIREQVPDEAAVKEQKVSQIKKKTIVDKMKEKSLLLMLMIGRCGILLRYLF